MDPIRDILGWTAAICGALLLAALTAALCGLLGLFVLSRYRKLESAAEPEAPEDPPIPPGTWYSKTTVTETPLVQKEEFSCACGGELKVAKVEATDAGVATTYRCEKCGREFTS